MVAERRQPPGEVTADIACTDDPNVHIHSSSSSRSVCKMVDRVRLCHCNRSLDNHQSAHRIPHCLIGQPCDYLSTQWSEALSLGHAPPVPYQPDIRMIVIAFHVRRTGCDRTYNAGSRRSPHRLTPSLLATREHARRACAPATMAAPVVLALRSV